MELQNRRIREILKFMKRLITVLFFRNDFFDSLIVSQNPYHIDIAIKSFFILYSVQF